MSILVQIIDHRIANELSRRVSTLLKGLIRRKKQCKSQKNQVSTAMEKFCKRISNYIKTCSREGGGFYTVFDFFAICAYSSSVTIVKCCRKSPSSFSKFVLAKPLINLHVFLASIAWENCHFFDPLVPKLESIGPP